MIVVSQTNIYSYIGTTRYHSVPTNLHLKNCSGQLDLSGHGQRKCRHACCLYLGDNDIACQMVLRLRSEEYTAYLKNEQTGPRASAVWKGFAKNQAQYIFHCKDFHQRKNIRTFINIAPMLFVFLGSILDKTHKMLYWFCVIYASSPFAFNRFPSFPDVAFNDSQNFLLSEGDQYSLPRDSVTSNP